MTTDLTEFVVIPSVENYEINRLGQIRKQNTNEIKTPTTINGYQQIYLQGKQRYVHRLVAETFVENDDPETKKEVDHIDRDRSNNRFDNLRWVTRSTNLRNKTRSSRSDKRYQYFDKVPAEAKQIFEIKGRMFVNLFYLNKTFYVDQEVNVKKLEGWISYNQRNYSVYDSENKKIRFSVKQFLESNPQFTEDYEVEVCD